MTSALRPWLRGILGGAALAITLPVAAQDSGPLDLRVGDANNQVGSGGRNFSVDTTYRPDFANLYITGNISGGKSFQAFSPIQDPNSLQIGLGSSSLSNFRRDSISLDDALRGRTLAPTPYFSREQTVTNLGTLSAGLERHDPLRSFDVYGLPRYDPTRTGDFHLPLTLDRALQQTLGPLSSRPYESSSLPDSWTSHVVFSRRPVLQFEMPEHAFNPQPRPQRAADPITNPFELPLSAESVDLLTRSNLLSPTLQAEIEQQVRAVLEGTQQRESTRTLPAEIEPGETELPGITPADPLQPRIPEATPDTADEARPEEAVDYQPSGTDLYADMLGAYRGVTQLQEQGIQLDDILTADLALLDRYGDLAAEIRRRLQTPPDALAGTGETQVQRLLFHGDEFLRDKQFYRAESAYAKAAVLEPGNPLPLLGQGHALLAAGEYYSAVLQISRAIKLFPAIGLFRLDLRRLVGDSDLLERRRADLESRLSKQEDYQFRFLLGYIEYFSGLEKYGRQNLRLAAEAAPADSGIASLLQYLIEVDEGESGVETIQP